MSIARILTVGAAVALLLAGGLKDGLDAAAPTCRSMRFSAGGDLLAYRSCGAGQPVLIVPGGPGLDADYMLDVARMVADAGFRAVLLEPRGTGASRHALGAGGGLSVSGSVGDVEALRKAIGAPRVRLLGHSFGGAVAQAYAACHPERVAQLILMNSVGPNMHPRPGSLDGWRRRLSPAEAAAYDSARARGDRRTAMRIKFAAGFADRRRGDAFVRGLPDSRIHLDLEPLSAAYAADYSVTGPVTAFPVAIIAGEMDWLRGYEPDLRATYPEARWLVIARASHFPWAEARRGTGRALRQALRGPPTR